MKRENGRGVVEREREREKEKERLREGEGREREGGRVERKEEGSE